MKLVTAADVWYTQQQKTLDEIAEKLGVVAYRPSYHGAERDKNTVLFYLKEDEEHNREVDRQPVRYSRSEAKDRGVNVNSECVYRDHFWSFENSDANGQLDMFFRSDKKSVEFRDFLGSVYAQTIKLEPGAFRESGTDVATRIVKIRKPM